MNKPTITMLCHTLKGAGMSCLYAMISLKVPMGVTELEAVTGYDRNIVRKGLDKLAALGLATQNGRYDSWTLTANGLQMQLIGVLPANTGNDAEKNSVPACSSSYINIESLNKDNTLLLLQANDAEKNSLVSKLIGKGCYPNLAKAALEAATQKWDIAQIEEEIDKWLAYCTKNKSIKNAGILTATRIKQLIEGPEMPESDETEEIQWQR